MQTKWTGILAAAFFAIVFGVGVAQAVSFTNGNNPEPLEQNILFNTTDTPLAVLPGALNQSGDIFNFTNSENLIAPSSGQARLEAADGTLTSLRIQPAADVTFQDVILAINLTGTGQVSGSVQFTAILDVGANQVSGALALGPGENFFTIVAGPGEALRALVLNETGQPIQDVRQIRISGCDEELGCPSGRPVPEPGTLAMLGGSMLGLVAFAARRRTRR